MKWRQLLTLACLGCLAGTAHAYPPRSVFSLGINLGGPVYRPYYWGPYYRPYYYYGPPVIVEPAPIVVQPRPVYVSPAPAVIATPATINRAWLDHDGRR